LDFQVFTDIFKFKILLKIFEMKIKKFIGVLFALKVLTTHHLPSGTVYLFNTIPVPSKYAYWVELVSISLMTPNVSFAGGFLSS